ncbi:MAG: hypothetical protein ACOC1L_07030 [Bacillota bacterium]
MANRKYQGRSVSGSNDFIHIDLLPDVKRPRQFNVNILLLVLIAVFASWLVIYLPLTSRQDRLDNALEERSDLQYQLLLVNEERVGYNIEEERLVFSALVDNAIDLQIDVLDYHDQIASVIEEQGVIRSVYYDHITHEFMFDVDAPSGSDFINIDFALVELPFVVSSTYSVSSVSGSGANYQAAFLIEVNVDAE